MSDAKDPYPIEPPSGPDDLPTGRPVPPPASAGPKPKIEAPGLLDDFEEDADFSADPELDLAVGRKPTVVTSVGAPAPEVPPFVKPGLGEARHWAIVGAVLLVAAMIATAVTAVPGTGAGQIGLRILLTVYSTLVSAGTGVVAVYIAARLLEQPLGNVELAAARMFTAVSAFVLVQSLSLRLTGVDWIDNTINLVLATAAYLGTIAATFRIWDRIALAYIAGSHMLLWLVMLVGMALSAAIRPPPARPTGTSTPIRTPAPAEEPRGTNPPTAPPNATPIQ